MFRTRHTLLALVFCIGCDVPTSTTRTDDSEARLFHRPRRSLLGAEGDRRGSEHRLWLKKHAEVNKMNLSEDAE